MGGRGASSGTSVKGKKYGTEYTTLLTSGNIKYVKYNDSKSAKTPMETMTKGRIYATVDANNALKAITYYDNNGSRVKQIDINGAKHKVDGKYIIPHTHMGYVHDENGTFKPTNEDKKIIDKVIRLWDNHNRK